MDTIHIIFIGLIAHINVGTLNTAVLVYAPNHVAQGVIFRADGTQTPLPALKDVRVSINGGGGPTGPNSTALLGNTPSLNDITETNCKLRAAIKKRQLPDASVNAYVDYAGGTLMPTGYQKYKVYFDDGGPSHTPQCTACGAELQYDVAAGQTISVVIFDKDGNKLPDKFQLSKTDVLVFQNAVNDGISHFDHFYDLLEGEDCKIKDMPIKSTETCSLPRCTHALSFAVTNKGKPRRRWKHFDFSAFNKFTILDVDLECTNSHWP
jgi:hypothetical protein